MALGAKVKERRLKLGWKQVTLAKQADIPQATVSRIERGEVTQPKMGQLKKLAEALGTTIDYLVGDSIEMSFEDFLRDKQAQVIFRGWEKLSAAEKEQLADLVGYFEQKAAKRLLCL